jgi:hypothetical protein
MKYELADQPPLLNVAVGVCLIVLLVSFCATFYATLAIIGRLADRADEREIPWNERAAIRMSRFGRFFLADEHRQLRRLYFTSWSCALSSTGLLVLLLFLVGKPAPT